MTDPKKDPRRRCLEVEAWPAADQAAWREALQGGDLLDESGTAAHWRPDTIHKNRRGYGRWLNFCGRHGLLLDHRHPTDRVTLGTLRDYLAELKGDGVMPYTIRNRVAELLAVMAAFAPEREWAWLRRLAMRLDVVACAATASKSPLPPVQVSAWAHARFAALERDAAMKPMARAKAWLDALLIGLLALCPTLRRANFAMMTCERHLRWTGDGYMLSFTAAEMKQKRAIDVPVPAELIRPIQRYLEQERSVLLKGRTGERFWIGRSGRPMSDMALYHRVCRITRETFGKAQGPHLFRHGAATHVAIHDSVHACLAGPLLGHSTPRTTEAYYNMATSLEASRAVRRSILSLRARLPAAARPKGAARNLTRHRRKG
jgi:integrase